MARKKTNAKPTGKHTDKKPREPMMTKHEVEKLIHSTVNKMIDNRLLAFEAGLARDKCIQPRPA